MISIYQKILVNTSHSCALKPSWETLMLTYCETISNVNKHNVPHYFSCRVKVSGPSLYMYGKLKSHLLLC